MLDLRTAGSSLKVVSTMSAGYDHVDVSALKKRNIRFGTSCVSARLLRHPSRRAKLTPLPLSVVAPDALTDATADIGAMLALMATRRAGEVRFKLVAVVVSLAITVANADHRSDHCRVSERSSMESGPKCRGTRYCCADTGCRT